ncbi:MAG TPA: MFS transporter, partial [Roseiflexaceae bacterium]|nr:MFS transporter [Roseiflexaceae bacterium]
MIAHNAAETQTQHHTGRAYWSAFAATMLFFGGFYTLLAPLPAYLARAGLPDWQIGVVLGAFGVASLVGRPLAGMAADRYGARPVMLAGALALIIGAAAVPYTGGFLALFALRVLQAAGYVAFTTAGTALVIALTPEAERGRRLAIYGAAANVAITLVPAAMGALLAAAPVAAPFLAAGGLALVAGAIASRISAPAAPAIGGRGIVLSRRLLLPMLIAGLFGAGFAAFFQFSPILAERGGGLPAGALYTVYGIGIITTRLAGGRLLDRLPVAAVLRFAALSMALGLALLGFFAPPAAQILAVLLIAIGSGLSHPALLAHHAVLLPDAPGRASAIFYLAFDL